MTRLEKKEFTLRPYHESDKERITHFEFNYEFFESVGWNIPEKRFSKIQADEWFKKKTNPENTWAIEVQGDFIGSVWIHSIDKKNRSARYAIEIYDQKYWNKGLGRKITLEIIKFVFDELKLHRLDLRVLTDNQRAIACYESCGFKREGIQRDTLYLNNKWHSDLWMSILEDEYLHRSQ